jgi:hypothetical protein
VNLQEMRFNTLFDFDGIRFTWMVFAKSLWFDGIWVTAVTITTTRRYLIVPVPFMISIFKAMLTND